MHRFANPARFLRFAAVALPWFSAAAVLCMAAGLAFGLFVSPADYQQGETVRIMYVHVPSAWMAMFAYTVVAGGSISALVWKHPLGEIVARAAAPIGTGFTLVCLVTGALWGKPMWGAWWVWDARLTSVLVLFFLYLGYMALLGAFDDPVRGGRAASILAIVGLVNVPIIKWSVDWWNTLHQPASVARMDGPAIHSSMLVPLLLMAAGFACYFAAVLLLRVRAEVAARRIRTLRLAAMEAES
ncbi:cytochrome C biogenesis protein CcmC [Allostella vacuolata]|nr:cytochrome C biogenesis protein CcmC [Stella vacuolata]